MILVDDPGPDGMGGGKANPEALANAVHERGWLLHPGVMYRASVFRQAALYTDQYPAAEDYEMFLRISATHEGGVVPEPLLTYVLCPSGFRSCDVKN